MPVTLSAAKGLARRTQRSFAARRRDSQDLSPVRSREVLSPNVWEHTRLEETVQHENILTHPGGPALYRVTSAGVLCYNGWSELSQTKPSAATEPTFRRSADG